MQNKRRNYEKGVSAILFVIFTTLILSIMTISFIGLMYRERSRSSDDEISQSAYDSALAGVEDGKRALMECINGDAAACEAIAAGDCSTIIKAGIAGDLSDLSEVRVVSTLDDSGEELNQAYTCVIINRATSDYRAELNDNGAVMIPLDGVSDFDSIRVSWFLPEDYSNSGVGFPAYSLAGTPLEQYDNWQANVGSAARRPPMLRTQLLQYDSAAGVDSSAMDQDKYNNALFLYPTNTVGINHNFSDDTKRSPGKDSSVVECQTGVLALGYACSTEIRLADMNNRQAYLFLRAIYGATHVRVELLSGGNVVDFNGVQPSIDSTGRAGDLFRRVEARVELGDNGLGGAAYPQAAVDLNSDFCKAFAMSLGNSDDVYSNSRADNDCADEI